MPEPHAAPDHAPQLATDHDTLLGSPHAYLRTIRAALICLLCAYAAFFISLVLIVTAFVPGLQLVAILSLPPIVIALVLFAIGGLMLAVRDATDTHDPFLSRLTLRLGIGAQAVVFSALIVQILKDPDAPPPEALSALAKLLTAIITAAATGILIHLARQSPSPRTAKSGTSLRRIMWVSLIATGVFWTLHALAPKIAVIPGLITLGLLLRFFVQFLGVMFRVQSDIHRITRHAPGRQRPGHRERPHPLHYSHHHPEEFNPLAPLHDPH